LGHSSTHPCLTPSFFHPRTPSFRGPPLFHPYIPASVFLHLVSHEDVTAILILTNILCNSKYAFQCSQHR
ncbi:hypothetical protein L9F63_026052, partial [Diploptera punctata]